MPNRTTVTVSQETLNRIKSEKPFESMTHEEFFNDVLDRLVAEDRDG